MPPLEENCCLGYRALWQPPRVKHRKPSKYIARRPQGGASTRTNLRFDTLHGVRHVLPLATGRRLLPVTARDATGAAREVRVERQGDTALLRFGLSSQSTHLQFTLYRWTEFVTYTVSSVLAVGYAYSAALVSLRLTNSRVPKPWRKAYGGHTPVFAPGILRAARRAAPDAEGRYHYTRAEVGVPGGGGARSGVSGRGSRGIP